MKINSMILGAVFGALLVVGFQAVQEHRNDVAISKMVTAAIPKYDPEAPSKECLDSYKKFIFEQKMNKAITVQPSESCMMKMYYYNSSPR